MAKTLNEIAHEYAVNNPNVSVELAFLEGMLYKVKEQRISVNERRDEFKKLLSLYIPQYGSVMINEFYEYWSETNANGTKMRFEKEKTWELSKRLKRWTDNNKRRYDNRNNFSKESRGGESLFSLANDILSQHK